MNKKIAIILTLLTLTFSCKFKDKTSVVENKTTGNDTIYKKDSLTSVINANKQYFKDSLLNEKSGIIDNYFSSYQADSCGILTYKNSELKEEFEGIRIVKGIRTNKQSDTVFVIPTFNYCDDGESYCFYDKTLPRLYTDSYCCHPDNFFLCNDIDEDGINEVGIFYSSCASRYKSLRIFSLKNGKWKEIGTSDFDVLTQDPVKVRFNKLVKKVSKGKFKICNFIEGQTKWEIIEMK
ncbi:MAG: hypothetical protein IPO83_15325 [Chitinophagaceae bacterium]|nr:hypothetical protein [Chitinophagaceae bacterium]